MSKSLQAPRVSSSGHEPNVISLPRCRRRGHEFDSIRFLWGAILKIGRSAQQPKELGNLDKLLHLNILFSLLMENDNCRKLTSPNKLSKIWTCWWLRFDISFFQIWVWRDDKSTCFIAYDGICSCLSALKNIFVLFCSFV